MTEWPDNDIMLARFRDWLDEAQAEAESIPADDPIDGPTESYSVGLFQLLGEFTALRHELKLETKSTRSLQEQATTLLDAMNGAIQQFRSVNAKESQAAEQAAKPLIEAIVDLHEALQRGQTVIETARQRILDELPRKTQDQLEGLFQSQSWWRRWLCRGFYRETRQIFSVQTVEVQQKIFNSLIEGYGLIQSRLARVMERENIYRIDCVGKPVDPNCMMVIETVDEPGRPPGMVVDEVRPGYYWKAKVFRFAEVRAVQSVNDP